MESPLLLALLLVGLLAIYYTLKRALKSNSVRLSAKGKSFVVTGAASGFGKEVTRLLAEQGAFVFAVDLNEELLLQEWSHHPSIQPLRGDVTDRESIDKVVQEVKDSGRPLFGLFNNAGIAHSAVSIVDCPEEVMVRTMNVNCLGIYRMTKAFFPLLKEENEKLRAAGQGSCAIVNMVSVAGLVAVPLLGAYCVSKHAAQALNDVLRRELKPLGIRVCAIQPFFARTPILDVTKNKFKASEECWAGLAESQNTILASTSLLEPVTIAEAVIDAFLNDPGPPHTIVMKSSLESLVVKRLLSFLPTWVLDEALTNRVLKKTQKKR